MEKENKWPEDRQRRCVFCDEGKEEESLEHYVKNCQRIKEWFVEIEEIDERVINRIVKEDLDEIKSKVIKIMEREREIRAFVIPDKEHLQTKLNHLKQALQKNRHNKKDINKIISKH